MKVGQTLPQPGHIFAQRVGRYFDNFPVFVGITPKSHDGRAIGQGRTSILACNCAVSTVDETVVAFTANKAPTRLTTEGKPGTGSGLQARKTSKVCGRLLCVGMVARAGFRPQ